MKRRKRIIDLEHIDNRDKIFVSVGIYYTHEGEIIPEYIEWEDGRTFRIEDARAPIRMTDLFVREIYPVKIRGSWKYLYYQDPQFFVLSPREQEASPPEEV